MKIRNTLITLMITVMLSVSVQAEVPYQSLYYDGANHQYTADKINLSINGVKLEEENLPLQPINIDGARTLVPLREVFESLGAKVNFDSNTNTVTVIDGDNTVVVTVGSTVGFINGNEVAMDVAPKYVSLDSSSQKKVMIPLRFVGEGLGYEVNYDSTTRMVNVNKPEEVIEEVVLENEIILTEANSSEIPKSSEATAKLTSYTLPTEVNQTITLKFDTPVTSVQKSTLRDGRLIIDIDNSILGTNVVDEKITVGNLENFKLAQFATTPIPATRMVLAFNADTSYSVNLSDDRKILVVNYGENSTSEITDDIISTTENVKVESVTYTSGKDADLFTLKGVGESPVLDGIIKVNENTLFIDILRPNTILDNAQNNIISKNETGVGVSSYKIFDVNENITRIEVALSKDCFYNVVENGNLTKIYIKPLVAETKDENTNIAEGNTNTTVENKGVVTLSISPRTTTLKINKNLANIPADFNINNIVHTDKYMKYSYELDLPINLQYVLPNQNFGVNDEILKSIDVVNSSDKTKFVFNGENVLHASVTEDSENIIFTIKSARDVYDKIIVIDAGHGGTDPGTQGIYNNITYYEKTVVLDIAEKTAEYISADTRFKVYETRPDDVFVERADRPAFSSKLQADMFISIHANAATSSVANGIETFYFDVEKEDPNYLAGRGVYPNEHRKEVTAKSKDFAKVMHENLISTTLLTDRKYQHKDLQVLRSNEVPSILIETGFMTNQRELLNLIDENYRTKVARCIADTVISYYESY